MSKWDDAAILKTYAGFLGVSQDEFKPEWKNPANDEVLNALEHNDMWGMESKIFGICFQEVRKAVGPYKIFGSQENQAVSSCVHAHADAWHKTLRAMGEDV